MNFQSAHCTFLLKKIDKFSKKKKKKKKNFFFKLEMIKYGFILSNIAQNAHICAL